MATSRMFLGMLWCGSDSFRSGRVTHRRLPLRDHFASCLLRRSWRAVLRRRAVAVFALANFFRFAFYAIDFATQSLQDPA
jgi:hypothetical protein